MRRRLVVGVAAALAAGGVVLLDPASAPAMAVTSPAPPITVPSSVVGSLDSASALERARLVGNVAPGLASGWNVPVSASGGIFKTAAAGSPSPFTAGVVGFFLGFEGTNTVLRLAGVDNVGFEALWDEFGPEPDPTYIPNPDVPVSFPGWAGDPTRAVYWAYCGTTSGGGCTGSPKYDTTGWLNIVTAPPVGQAGPLVVQFSTIAYPGSGWGGLTEGSSAGSDGFSVLQHNASGVASGSPSSAWPTGKVASGGTVMTSTMTMGVGWDHLVLTAQAGHYYAAATWYPPGHALRPADVVGDPVRSWVTRWQCQGGGVVAASSAAFRESDPAWPGFPQASCPSGNIPQWVEVWEVTEGGSAEDFLVERWTPNEALLDWQTTYPQCVDGSCQLLLSRIDPQTSKRLSCFANPSLCVDWWTDPARADNYECTYGGAVVAVEECSVYSPTFNVATGSEVKTSGGTRISDPIHYADPRTGEPQAGGDPTPDPEPGSSDCPPPFAWNSLFNPWWYYKGFTCGLEWAFVPSGTEVQTKVQQLNDGLSSHAPFSVIVAVPGIFDSFGDGWSGGCSGLPDFSTIPGKPLRMACSPPDSPGWQAGYTLMSIVLWVGVALAVWKMAHHAVGGKS